jgi:predicted pyridoxine 5'-phosphate oxidase superfamily flavin-nucleotide-binding protein
MGILTADMRRMVEEQQLGFIATVCADGTPNLSPKGTTAVWDDEHLVFAVSARRVRLRICGRTHP